MISSPVIRTLLRSMLVISLVCYRGIAAGEEPAANQPEAVDAVADEKVEVAPPVADAPADAPSDMDVASESFQKFCAEWLEKLVQREEQNASKIEWATSEIGVRGTFIGYSRTGRCETKRGTDAIPVGKLIYRQITFEKKGIDVGAAEASAARPLNVDEVTEIFHYSDGKWIY